MRLLGWIILIGAPILAVAPATAQRYDPNYPVCLQRWGQGGGTNIDCSVTTTDDGRFRVGISIEDSSVIPETPDTSASAAKGAPSFRTFRSNTSLLLKDGQTTQFTAATDKVTGEMVRVDVTLTVVN